MTQPISADAASLSNLDKIDVAIQGKLILSGVSTTFRHAPHCGSSARNG